MLRSYDWYKKSTKAPKLQSTVKKKKPLVLYCQKHSRFERAKSHKDWMEEHWRKVIFSYEDVSTKWATNKLQFAYMLSNVFNVIQRSSCIPEHSNVQSAKTNATRQIHVLSFTVDMWVQSPWKLTRGYLHTLLRSCWHHMVYKVFLFPIKSQFCIIVKGVALLLEVIVGVHLRLDVELSTSSLESFK